MCILFIAMDNSKGSWPYSLIVAANRDEFYQRPSKPADFWPDSLDNIGGLDMEVGREGGTWIALNTRNKRLGAILNILNNELDAGKQGRGFLIRDLINCDSETVPEYFNNLKRNADAYNPFNLVSLDLMNNQLIYFSNKLKKQGEESPQILTKDNVQEDKKVFAFGSSLYSEPFRKVHDGQEKFLKLLQDEDLKLVEDKEALLNEILKILKDETKYYPDLQMKSQAPQFSQKILNDMSCRFVKMTDYGTRTHTIILVTKSKILEYHEWTLEEPISKIQNWIYSSYEIDLKK